MKFKKPTKQRSNSIRSSGSSPPAGSSIVGIMIQITGLETELLQLNGQMSGETDYIKIEEIRARYIVIQLKIKELHRQIEEAKKSTVNLKI